MMFKKIFLLFSLFLVLSCCNPLFAESVDNESGDLINEQVIVDYTSSSEDSVDFSANVTEGINSLDVQFNCSSNDNDSSFLWDFGDGTNSSNKNPTHKYSKVGSYNVSLSIYNITNNSLSNFILKNNFIHVYKEKNPINVNTNPFNSWNISKISENGLMNWENGNCDFFNVTMSKYVNFDIFDSINFKLTSICANGFFGVYIDDELVYNGTIENLIVTFPPTFTVYQFNSTNINTSNVTGNHFLKFTGLCKDHFTGYNLNNIVVTYRDLLSNFTSSYSIVNNTVAVKFIDNSFGLISNWFWDFGDGTNSSEENPTHNFEPGNYRISLTVSNANYTKTFYQDLVLKFHSIGGNIYESVQDAINAASEGSVIDIPIDCFENLLINKSLTLNFNGNSLIANVSSPIINVTNGANVIISNISLSNADNVFATDESSKITIQNSNLDNANITSFSGNIVLNNNVFSNCYLTMLNASSEVRNCNISAGGIIIKGGKTKIQNNHLFYNIVSILQSGGESNIIGNIITDNTVGINITGGLSNISFNAIYSNTNYGIVYVGDVKLDYNWYNVLMPSHNHDIYNVNGNDSNIGSWLVLTFTPELDEVIVNNAFNVNVDLTHDNNGVDVSDLGSLMPMTLNFMIGNKIYAVPILDGKGKFLLSSNEAGDVISVNLFDEIYTLGVKVYNPLDTNVSVHVSDIIYGNGFTINVALLNNVSGNVNVIINNNNYNITVVNGTGSLDVSSILNAGNYDVFANFVGDNMTTYSSNVTTKFTVNKLATNIIASSVNTVYNGDKYLTITLKDAKGKVLAKQLIIVKLGSKSYRITTDNNGKAKLTTNNLEPKNYIAIITYAGTNNYISSAGAVRIIVKKATPILTVAKKKTYKVKVKTKKFSAALKDNKGKVLKNVKVTLKVKGKTYSAKTNGKGVATFKITKLSKKGTYKASVKFGGNSYYKSTSKNVKITVKK